MDLMMNQRPIPTGINYSANQPYNQSEEYQPHSTILEPAIYDDKDGALKFTTRPFQLQSNTYGSPAFLRAVSQIPMNEIAYAKNKYAWKYDSRHQAQAVLPFLYLGPSSVARDPTFINNNNITMVIVVRSAQSAKTQPRWLDPSRFQSCANIQTATFDVDGPYDLISRIKPMLKTITDHLESHTTKAINSLDDIGGRILIFCENGNDRSPVLVAAYLMLVFGMTWHESLNFIHAFRFSAAVNGAMNDMLKTWEGILRAENDTAALFNGYNHSNGIAEPPRKTKRSIDDAYDSDETMTEEVEVETRPGIAPFR